MKTRMIHPSSFRLHQLMQKPAQLKIVNRFGVTQYLPLSKRVFTIGRKAENDLQLLSDTVSRQHAEIVYEDESYVLVDVGSKRATLNTLIIDEGAALANLFSR